MSEGEGVIEKVCWKDGNLENYKHEGGCERMYDGRRQNGCCMRGELLYIMEQVAE